MFPGFVVKEQIRQQAYDGLLVSCRAVVEWLKECGTLRRGRRQDGRRENGD